MNYIKNSIKKKSGIYKFKIYIRTRIAKPPFSRISAATSALSTLALKYIPQASEPVNILVRSKLEKCETRLMWSLQRPLPELHLLSSQPAQPPLQCMHCADVRAATNPSAWITRKRSI